MKRKAVKKIISVGVVAAMAVSLAACGSSDSSSAASTSAETETPDTETSAVAEETAQMSGGVTLEFQQWWEPELPDGALQEICDEFTAETGINIELLSNPYADTKTQIEAGAASGTMADIVGLDGSWVYDFAKQNAITDLTTLMENDGYDESQLSDEIKVDGDTYMIPTVNFGYPLYVNTDILEEAGADTENLPTTWSEWEDLLQQVEENTDAAGYSIPLSTEAPNCIQNQVMGIFWASGGHFIGDDGLPDVAGNQLLADTVDLCKDMYTNGYISNNAFAMEEQDMVNEFENGRLATMIDGISHLTTITEESPDLNFTVTSIPVQDGYTGESGMCVAAWGIGIAENCEYKEEAWQFVSYLLSPEVNAQFAEVANAFPGNVNAEPDYSSNDEKFQECYEIFQSGYAINEFTGAPVAEDLQRSFNEQMVLYIDGDTATVDDMLEAVQEHWDEDYQ